jgi:hypothetical protein
MAQNNLCQISRNLCQNSIYPVKFSVVSELKFWPEPDRNQHFIPVPGTGPESPKMAGIPKQH